MTPEPAGSGVIIFVVLVDFFKYCVPFDGMTVFLYITLGAIVINYFYEMSTSESSQVHSDEVSAEER